MACFYIVRGRDSNFWELQVKVAENRIHSLVLALTLILVNWRATTPMIVRVKTDGLDPIATLEIAVAFGLGATLVLLLRRAGLLRTYMELWRRHLLLVLFSALAFLSVLWSVSPSVSLYKWTVFALGTLVGSFLGFRFSARGLLEVLFWYGAFVLILSAAIALIIPVAGTMPFLPYNGAWRGIFWHRNHLGILVALLNVVYLYRLEDGVRRRRAAAVVDGFLYASCVLVVWLSRSATGFLVLVAGNSLSALAYVWHRTRARLRRPHYMMALALGVGALYTISVRHDALLAMLGRNTSLTGRIPMWQTVLGEFVSQRPVLGFGLGAFWNSLSNRAAVQQAIGWGTLVEIGDNGWLDVQLGLGGIGLAFFMLLLMALLYRGVDRMRRGHEFVDSLPLVFLLMASLANVAFSLFFEIESGVWLILVAFSFLQATRTESPQGRALVS